MSRSVFTPIPPAEQKSLLEEYARFLKKRDGEPDFARRTLAHREETTQRFEQAASLFDGFDHELFAAQYARFDARRPTPAEVLLLLVYVKINANEAYAVQQVLKREPRPPAPEKALEHAIESIVFLEEDYHTRLLLSAARLFGVKVTEACDPTAGTRAIVTGITRLPDALARPLTFSGEIVGIVTFLRLLSATRRLFARQAELRDALEERLMAVLVDELGHLSLNRLLMTQAGYHAARVILPMVALGTHGSLPDADALGVLPVSLREVHAFDPKSLPKEVLRQSFLA